MIERIEGLPSGCDGITAKGEVTREDYQQTVGPLFEQAYREGRHLRFLYHIGPDFDKFTAGAAWEDMRLGLHYPLRLFERCAVVSDLDWVRGASRLAASILPCPCRIFGNAEWDAALDWLSSTAPASGLTHRLIPELGVLLVEPHGALRAEDFESMSLTVDPWIEAKGSLHGLVIHTRKFPGWDNFSAFLGQLRFVWDHHRKIRRVAVVADGKAAELAPELASHFVQAEILRFEYDRLEEALTWASVPTCVEIIQEERQALRAEAAPVAVEVKP